MCNWSEAELVSQGGFAQEWQVLFRDRSARNGAACRAITRARA